MYTVYICGDNSKAETAKILTATIKAAEYGFVHIKDNSVSVCPSINGLESFVIIESDRIEKINADCPIVLFNEGSYNAKNILTAKNYTSIIDTDSEKAPLELLAEGVKTITCGLSSKNTVTFSSFENECAVISLQRSLTTVGGTLYEPCDVPITLSSLRILPESAKYPLLASAAVLFFAGTEFTKNGLIV